jgi:hypothetical protein
MELTIMLVKDDRNTGFPVAFFLSNRMDQIVQEVFFRAIKVKLQQEIKPSYFMSDDDSKYFNAWVKVMDKKPRRLLCTRHVIKNWNIQGKTKIKNLKIKKTMKLEMKTIMKQMYEQRFTMLYQNYFQKLEEADEQDFLNYLKRYTIFHYYCR